MSEQTPVRTGRVTHEELDALLHHGHVIPVSRGVTDRHVAEHFPGWTWNRLMDVWRPAGIVDRGSPGEPLRCRDDVVAVDLEPSGCVVERADGSVTRSAVDVRTGGADPA